MLSAEEKREKVLELLEDLAAYDEELAGLQENLAQLVEVLKFIFLF